MRELTEQERLDLWLGYGVEHSAAAFARVLEAFPHCGEALESAKRGGRALSMVPERAAKRLREAAQAGFMDRYLERLDGLGIDIATLHSADYPELLRGIHDPPGVLFIRGRLRHMPLPLAIVGARVCTSYGRTVAQSFAMRFAQSGAAVVSGLATGVDACAAQGALDVAEADFPTVAVLGTGIDIVYPAENRRLNDEIRERGAVVSEFLPGVKGRPEHFPLRNRIISGLSLGVVVVEAGERSGTSITAACALEQGRDVFAVPGRITDPKSVGTNRLIQQGCAKPVFCPEDVLVEYPGLTAGAEKAVSDAPPYMLSGEERRIYEALESGEKSADELMELTGLPIGKLNSCLTAMEFSEIMKQLPGRLYAVDARRPVRKK